MNSFEVFMIDNFLKFNIVVFLICFIYTILINKKIKKGFVQFLVGFLAVIIISLISTGLLIAAIGAFHYPSFWKASKDSPGGLFAWSIETGVEFGAIGQILGLIAFIILRIRHKAVHT